MNITVVKKKQMDDFISYIKLGLYTFFAWLGISIESFEILIYLMCLDSLMGIVKALRMNKQFSFSILIWGFVLKLCFLIIPLVVALLGRALDYDLTTTVSVVVSILSVSEVYSITGNIYSAKNKVEVKKVDAVSLLLKSIRNIIFIYLSRILKKLENLAGK